MRKAVFIHLEKCAGTYISYILCTHGDFVRYRLDIDFSDKAYMHTGYYEHIVKNPVWSAQCGMDADKWRNYAKFSFVRNPYDRMVSGYKYMHNHAIRNSCRFLSTQDAVILCGSLGDVISRRDELSTYAYHHIFLSNSKSLSVSGVPINLSFVGRVEDIDADLEILMTTLDIVLPGKISNEYKNSSAPTFVHTALIREFAREFFRDDYIRFGYSK